MIEIYTDGSCKPTNPGYAGYGVVGIVDGKMLLSHSNYLGEGTNNIAELSAILFALDWLIQLGFTEDKIVIHTDSSYSIGVLTKGWKAKANIELIGSIKERLENFSDLEFQWVKGHNGNKLNELADKLANNAVDSSVKEG